MKTLKKGDRVQLSDEGIQRLRPRKAHISRKGDVCGFKGDSVLVGWDGIISVYAYHKSYIRRSATKPTAGKE